MPAPAEVDPEAEGPASFRVYTPAELRHAPLRMSRVAFERHSAPPPASSPALLTWLGAGVALGVLLLTLGVVALTVGEGGGYAGVRLRTMMAAEPTPEVAPVAVAMVPAIKSLDLPDEAPPPKPRPKAKKARIVLPANPF